MEVCIAAFFRETWHDITGIGKQNKLVDGLSRSETTACNSRKISTYCFEFNETLEEAK
jgi:hypothetical protein